MSPYLLPFVCFQGKKLCPDLVIVQVPTANGKADLTTYRHYGAKVMTSRGSGLQAGGREREREGTGWVCTMLLLCCVCGCPTCRRLRFCRAWQLLSAPPLSRRTFMLLTRRMERHGQQSTLMCAQLGMSHLLLHASCRWPRFRRAWRLLSTPLWTEFTWM